MTKIENLTNLFEVYEKILEIQENLLKHLYDIEEVEQKELRDLTIRLLTINNICRNLLKEISREDFQNYRIKEVLEEIVKISGISSSKGGE